MGFPLEGSHFLVTGGASGIGKGVTSCLIEQGASVSVVDVDAETGATFVDENDAAKSQLRFYECDITDATQVHTTVCEIIEELGPLHGLVNSAGIQETTPIMDIPLEKWQQHLDVNTTGTFLVTQEVCNHMITEEIDGTVVNIGSVAASLRPRPGQGAYAASKAAMTTFTIVLAQELAEFGINCNVVHPGPIDTPMFRNVEEKQASEERATQLLLDRIGRPEDVGYLVTFLLSDMAEWITGQSFTVDGGVVHR
ncbi:NAD(P)-dependent oxidoreductase [Haloferax sp. Atlit-4N]|uniref:SDR family NAD(P)-dependent oxidoreductase n=1 Tax=Haloferax sp. Atlit-4N TaxID=2077206 RepID=UPI000E223B3B|nr:SDR family oxidoreductase [Haloferax sp. Atlit-4N]RDZ51334.1 NAD(P)-dependent oxidoreductase [Haloferax sp. Atlit-4N]